MYAATIAPGRTKRNTDGMKTPVPHHDAGMDDEPDEATPERPVHGSAQWVDLP
jgi:hypothetical protein